MRWPLGGRSIRSVGRSHRGADSGSRIEAVGGSHMGDRGDNGTGTYTGYKTEIEAIDPEQQESTMDFQRVGVKRWMSG